MALVRVRSFMGLFIRALMLILSGEFGRVALAVRSRAVTFVKRHTPPERIQTADLLPADAPLVSIIIPCFNYGQFVQDAIDSVLAQTLKDVEIVVVDGGSTDGKTRNILNKLDRPRTRVHLRDGLNLVGDNRNFGILVARGRYVCCLDADDTLEPTYLEKAVYLLETYGNDIVSTGIHFFGERTGMIDVIPSVTLRDMLNGNHISTCAVFRRALWARVGGYVDSGRGPDHVAEDWDFWVRLAATGVRIRNIAGEHLFNYRIHREGSLSTAPGVKPIEAQRAAILERNRHLLDQSAFKRSDKAARRNLVSDVAGGLLTVRFSPISAGRSLLLAMPLMIIGGAERLLSQVTAYLARHGWRVTVISTLPQDPTFGDASDWFRVATSEVYSLPRFLGAGEYERFIEYLMESRKFDALLLAGSDLIYGALPKIISRYRATAIIDLLFNVHGHTRTHLAHRHEIDFAIGESTEVVEWFVANGWTTERVYQIESAIDVARYQTIRPIGLAEDLGIDAREIVIGFSSRLSDEKAPEMFLELAAAFRSDPRVRFVMTGAGPLSDRIEAKITALPNGTRLNYLGSVEDVTPYFALYDVFVLPSKIDGRPIALLEALASGCAIVASRVGGIPSLVNDTIGILCPPAHTVSFIAAVSALISDKRRLAAMKKAARAYAEQHLSVERMGRGFAQAIETAISFKEARTNVIASPPQSPVAAKISGVPTAQG